MKKNAVFYGAAALAFGIVTASCSKDSDVYNPSGEQEQINKTYAASFEEKVGTVNANQDWKTISQHQAEITVSLGLDQSYTVAIYTGNPLFDGQSSLLALTKVSEGNTAKLTFDAPTAQETYYVGVFDSKGRGVTETASMVNGKIIANVGGASAKSRITRATEAEFPAYARTAADYLSGLTVAEMEAYPAFTNADLAQQSTLSNPVITWPSNVYIGEGDGLHYRVAANTEITSQFHINGHDANWNVILNGAVIYVQGKMKVGTNYTLNGVTIVVADGGELVIDGTVNMSTFGRFVVLPGGKVTGTAGSTWTVCNAGSCYNAGQINYAGELNVNGSDFYNNGTLNVASLRNTSGGKITNFGSITAGTNVNAADSYNCEMINGCYWHYTGNAGIGQLTMLKNSRLDVDGVAEFTQSWNNSFDASDPANALAYVPANPNILMDKAVVNVGTAFCTNTVFQGPSAAGEFAIVKMNKVQVGNGTDLMQRGNCYFDWDITELYRKGSGYGDTTNETKYKDIPAAEKVYNKWGYLVDYYRVHLTKFTTEATSPFTVPAGDCTGDGYNDTDEPVVPILVPGTGDKPLPIVYSVAFEDLGAIGDFDFNDVVLYVEHNVETNKANVKFMAAGGELTVDVKYGDEIIFTKDDGKLTNTTTKGNVIATTEVSMTGADDVYKFSIVVKKDNGNSLFVSSATQKGKSPQALVIPGQWEWPTEYTNIKDAYPNIANWVKDLTNTDWYNNPVTGKVVR